MAGMPRMDSGGNMGPWHLDSDCDGTAFCNCIASSSKRCMRGHGSPRPMCPTMLAELWWIVPHGRRTYSRHTARPTPARRVALSAVAVVVGIVDVVERMGHASQPMCKPAQHHTEDASPPLLVRRRCSF